MDADGKSQVSLGCFFWTRSLATMNFEQGIGGLTAVEAVKYTESDERGAAEL